MQGNPLTLVGTPLTVGDKVPDCHLLTKELKPFALSSAKGKVTLLFSVPSLDTSVCSLETNRFNKEMEKFRDNVAAFAISMDLPFAQGRWCVSEGVKNLTVLSDHRDADFGQKFGILIKELRLLARAVFIVDREGVIRYHYVCKEVTQEPPYNEVLKHLNQLCASTV